MEFKWDGDDRDRCRPPGSLTKVTARGALGKLSEAQKINLGCSSGRVGFTGVIADHDPLQTARLPTTGVIEEIKPQMVYHLFEVVSEPDLDHRDYFSYYGRTVRPGLNDIVEVVHR
nr:hypothetical protein Itr_chr11CG11560 [Ipomoea trifida]